MSNEETLLKFPCDFPIKVIGHSTEEFHTVVLEILNRHVDKPAAPTVRPSRDDKYVALSISINATSQKQLDAIYTELSGHELVLFVL